MSASALLLKKCQSLLRSAWVSPPAFAVENFADLEQIFKVFRGEIKYLTELPNNLWGGSLRSHYRLDWKPMNLCKVKSF